MTLVFTGDEFREGLVPIHQTLRKLDVPGSFFLTGRFLEDRKSAQLIKKMIKQGYYVGPHSDRHLLYAPWENRDSLLVNKEEFKSDLRANIEKIKELGAQEIDKFIAPYEWYNKTIVNWTAEESIKLYNFTPGLRTAADYTYPEMGNRYLGSQQILEQLVQYEAQYGLHGFVIIIHLGTDPRRKDKFFNQLEKLIELLKKKNYKFVSLKEI